MRLRKQDAPDLAHLHSFIIVYFIWNIKKIAELCIDKIIIIYNLSNGIIGIYFFQDNSDS